MVCSLLAAAVALVVPSAVAGAPASRSFSIIGYEYAFTQTVGSFAGAASGESGDTAVWNATVKHRALGPTTTRVDGGSFQLGTLNPSTGHVDYVIGAIVYHSGTIAVLNRGANCTSQVYRVTGRLGNVKTRSASGGSGSFGATLTHYRYSIFGHCVTYKASIKGGVTFVR